jgi:ATP-dependent DNA helicase RecQ
LHDCLERFFGLQHFLSGQEEAIRAVLDGRDVAVFWATGSGKSMAFTLPPLLLQRTALIVSPLISLMQDQVHKLNCLSSRFNGSSSSGSSLATYLGSAQMDSSMERRALQGEFRLVFCTPEKLQAPGFLDAMGNLDLCLVAIDESHCVRYVNTGTNISPKYIVCIECTAGFFLLPHTHSSYQ